jgi:hemoglobin
LRITFSAFKEVNTAEKSLYERLGGVFGIAAVVDRFSDEVVKDQISGQGSKKPALKEWQT